MTEALQKLHQCGQSVWLDFITRQFMSDGRLADLIAKDGITGVTSNPAIFEKAITDGRISLADLLDSDYVVIPDSDPLQMMAKHTGLTDAILPGIIERLSTNGTHLVNMNIVQPTLEDVFISLTGKALRD